jgi:hypothetical protein
LAQLGFEFFHSRALTVAELESAGDLAAGFGPLLRAVPREWFVPERIWVDREPIDRGGEAGRWARAVYGDCSVVTQFDDGRTRWPAVADLLVVDAVGCGGDA